MRALKSRAFVDALRPEEAERLRTFYEIDESRDLAQVIDSPEGARIALESLDGEAIAALGLCMQTGPDEDALLSGLEDVASSLSRVGIVSTEADENALNISLAAGVLAAADPVYDFLPALLLRLDDETLQRVARHWEVGRKLSRVEHAIELASRMQDVTYSVREVATLRESDRAPLLEALDNEHPVDAPLSDEGHVSLAASPAGELGLLFTLETQEGSSAFVSNLLADDLRERLEQVPAAPDEVTRRRRRSSSGSPRRPRAPQEPLVELELEAPTEQALAPDIGKSVSISPASAVVEVSDPREARVALSDSELGAAILEVVEETLIVLRASVDVDDWVQRLAVRLDND